MVVVSPEYRHGHWNVVGPEDLIGEPGTPARSDGYDKLCIGPTIVHTEHVCNIIMLTCRELALARQARIMLLGTTVIAYTALTPQFVHWRWNTPMSKHIFFTG